MDKQYNPYNITICFAYRTNLKPILAKYRQTFVQYVHVMSHFVHEITKCLHVMSHYVHEMTRNLLVFLFVDIKTGISYMNSFIEDKYMFISYKQRRTLST